MGSKRYITASANSGRIYKVISKGVKMNTIHLSGADATKVAELIGGTLVMVNETDDTAMIAGGDVSLLQA